MKEELFLNNLEWNPIKCKGSTDKESKPLCSKKEWKIFHLFSIFVQYQDEKKSYKKGQKSLVLRTGKGNERWKPRK